MLWRLRRMCSLQGLAQQKLLQRMQTCRQGRSSALTSLKKRRVKTWAPSNLVQSGKPLAGRMQAADSHSTSR